jgi:hypothetical protein
MDEEPLDETTGSPEQRPGPACSVCGEPTRFDGGMSTHDLYAERFVCGSGHETFRSFGRGSVS